MFEQLSTVYLPLNYGTIAYTKTKTVCVQKQIKSQTRQQIDMSIKLVDTSRKLFIKPPPVLLKLTAMDCAEQELLSRLSRTS